MKSKQKAICVIVLILVLALMMFAGCGSNSNSTSSTSTESTNSTDTSSEEESVAEEGSKGHFSAVDMRAIKDQLSKDYDAGLLRGRTYEDIRDSYFKGVDGYLYIDTETTSQYYWYVIGTNEVEHVKVTFQDYGDGNKTAGGYGSYLP